MTRRAVIAFFGFLLAFLPSLGAEDGIKEGGIEKDAVKKDLIKKDAVLGPVRVTVSCFPAKPVIGDAVTLTVRAVAEQDVELLMPEFGEALDRFTILSFVPKQSIDPEGRTIAEQTYRLQTPSSGKHIIPPILLEFVDRRPGHRAAPEGLDAYELLTERIEFEVQSVIPKEAKADLKPPLGRLEPRTPAPPPRWPWILLILLLVGVASPFALRAFLAWQRRSRRRSAYEIAIARLERLLAARPPRGQPMDAFYVELSAIVRRYLEDRFDLRAPELTTEEFLENVQHAPDLSTDHKALLREFLRQADLVKFAGFQPDHEDVDRSVDAARRFLDETRENAPLLDEPHEDSAGRAEDENLPGSADEHAPTALAAGVLDDGGRRPPDASAFGSGKSASAAGPKDVQGSEAEASDTKEADGV